MKINQIRPQETNFTEVLDKIVLKPKMLYFIGKMPENVLKTVGIVGARKCTDYGAQVAYEAAYDLAKAGMVVVSGLAYGIDSIAARGALDAGGVTVAILGTPIDRIYPTEHLRLAEEIVRNGGAIISEYAPRGRMGASLADEGPKIREALIHLAQTELAPGEYESGGMRKIDHKTSFLYRNRLIAGLSDAVVIVEAAEKSGSLNTAAHALEQGKEVFAVPGDISRVTSAGCNRLIKQGAHPYLGSKEVLEVLFPNGLPGEKRRRKMPVFAGSLTERAVVGEIVAGNTDGEKIMAKLKLSAAEFLQTITMLEIREVVRPMGMNQWVVK